MSRRGKNKKQEIWRVIASVVIVVCITLFGYIKYILTHFECLIIILGIILLYLSFERKDKNELYL